MIRFLNSLKRAGLPAHIGIVLILLFAFAAIFAPWLAPYGESEVVDSIPWGTPQESGTLLGLDQLGRDLYSRVLYGARNTIALALGITVLAFFMGMTAGFFCSSGGPLGGYATQSSRRYHHGISNTVFCIDRIVNFRNIHSGNGICNCHS